MTTIADVESEVAFISGVTADGHLAPTSYGAWNGDRPATYNTVFTPAVKWFGDASDSHAGTTGGVVTYAFDPASNWSLVERDMFKAGLALWSAVVNISFVEVGNLASAELDFTRGNDGQAHTQGAYAFPAGAGAAGGTTMVQLTSATLSVDTSVPGFGPITNSSSVYGGYVWNTILHEEGHAIGLGHAGPYNGSVNPGTDQFSIYDTTQYSIMSYISGENPYNNKYGNGFPNPIPDWGTTHYAGADYHNVPTTWMPLDILAAQRLYGKATSSPLSGGQVFGFNSNITGDLGRFFDFSRNSIPVLTIWDSGQNNALDLTGFSADSFVDLHPSKYSSANGMVANIAIAFDTAVDTLRTGAGNDDITGNDDGNYIDAGAGDDTITAGAGNDTIAGGTGNNTINGGAGTNTLYIDDVSWKYTAYSDSAQATVTNGAISLTEFGLFSSVANASETDSTRNIQFVQFLDRKVAFLPVFNSTSYEMNIDPKIFPRTVFNGNSEQYGPYNDLYLLGASSDTVVLDNGTNYLLPGGGTDIVTGGRGIDTVMFTRSAGSYIVTHNANGSFNVKAPGIDVTMTGVENALLNVDTSKWGAVDQPHSYYAFARARLDIWNMTPVSLSEFAAESFTPLRYIASYPDLIGAFGSNQNAGLSHYMSYGYAEGRQATFSAQEYIASYPDLIRAFGTNQTAALTHYITSGYYEGRGISFDALEYISSYPDLIRAFGTDKTAAMNHYITQGYAENRNVSFGVLQYIASYGDLIRAYGTDRAGAMREYINQGYAEGRHTTFNALQYIASYSDLIHAFGTNQTAALNHYITQGYYEGRSASFNALQYVASYGDLIHAFGTNQNAAYEHYIKYGSNENRTPSFDALNYVASYGDLIQTIGTNQTAAYEQYINTGYNQGRTISFDPVAYLLNNPDLGAAGYSVKTAAEQYIESGYGEGRVMDAAFGTDQTQHALRLGIETDSTLTAGDKDWFSIDLSPGQYTLTGRNPDYATTLQSLAVTGYDSSGTWQVGFTGHAMGASASFTVAQAGTFYFTLAGGAPTDYGRYGIQVRAGV